MAGFAAYGASELTDIEAYLAARDAGGGSAPAQEDGPGRPSTDDGD